MQERQRSWSAVLDWTSCRVQASLHVPSVALEWAATASSAMAASTGCTRNAVGSSAWKITLTTDVHCAQETCYQQQVAMNSQPQHVWKQPGRSSRICYQFSLHATSFSKHVAVCTALECGAQCSMPARLGHWQSRAGLGGSVGCAVRMETRRSRVQPPPRSATFFRGDWSWNIFYGHSLPSADSRRAVVSFWWKNVHNTGEPLRGLSLPSKRVDR